MPNKQLQLFNRGPVKRSKIERRLDHDKRLDALAAEVLATPERFPDAIVVWANNRRDYVARELARVRAAGPSCGLAGRVN